MSQLAPCPSCARHVRVSEPVCPFCAGPLQGLVARQQPALRLTRAALFAFAAGAAMSSCSGESGDDDTTGNGKGLNQDGGGKDSASMGAGGIGGAYGSGPGTPGGAGGFGAGSAGADGAAATAGTSDASNESTGGATNDSGPDRFGGVGGAYGAGPGTPGGSAGSS